jgi:hypothetical protein
VARRVNHSDKELFSLVLQRFLCHKNHENIDFLVTSLLSSTAETKLFEKEQKFLKLHGTEKQKKPDQNPHSEQKSHVENESNFQQLVSMMQVMHSMFTPPRFAPPRFPATQRRGRAGGLPK